jgi:short-chain fatty acids transporter
VGYSILQCLVHRPLVFALMWLFAQTLTYHPPVFP